MKRMRTSPVDPIATGRQIVRLSLMNALPARELASRLGCSETSVRSWMRGTALPSLPYLLAMAELFGVYPDELICLRETGRSE